MKIFGKIFLTKKDLRAMNATLLAEREMLKEMFPFTLGQTVYDVAFRNAAGRYTKTNPSFEHSTITAVVVDEKNYFSLAKRYKRNDVFLMEDAAAAYLKTVCK